MRILWDEKNRRQVRGTRKIDFADVTDLLDLPYLEDQRIDELRQHRLIGFVHGKLTTYIVEYREDKLGEFLWVVTAWKSTQEETKAYEKEIN